MVSVCGHLFGTGDFSRDGRRLPLTPASTALFACLLLQRGTPIDRGRLADAVGERPASEGQTRRRLNTAIWRLRRQLEPDGVARESVLTTADHGLRVAEDCDLWVDVLEFESMNARLAGFDRWTERDAELAQQALDLYRGDFLLGQFTEWALAERARLADQHFQLLIRLAQWHQHRGEPEEALPYAQTAVDVEPLREDLHRLVMQLYAAAGLPQLAERQLQKCRLVLAEELGIEPLPETVAVARVASGPSRPSTASYDRAIRELESSNAELRRLSMRLQHSLRDLRRERDQLLRD
ncbi:BTAD domain-containing putative transcriptional regulator [Nocardioides sp.]|uniref:AfsR/SARP family transcriptional regulator n=1 Tax=Nocardioides sp. TaxID=35761 RepID=UPI002613126D|nr:BTAD domain-containing putative transcriptional regulator [Nocardioides sp.]MDI6911064.1 BTAD domain-containing putative transcriptional regulator [Nocardioides sp.]